MAIILTESQKDAFNKIKEFLNNEEPAITISGSAGTGKTTLMKYVIDYIIETNIDRESIIAISPTHKARRVLNNTINKDKFLKITTCTIASILGKVRELSYIGTKKFSDPCISKLSNYNIFILDEISMVLDSDLNIILNYICETDNKKIILIGDICQIPNPSQKIIRVENECFKSDSFAFNIDNSINLKEIVRQNKDSIIIKIATYIRDNINIDNFITKILDILEIPHEEIIIYKDLYETVLEDIKNNMTTRIIAYTNSNVRTHNLEVRKKLGYIEPFMINETLIGYNNVGFPNPFITNGSEYTIISKKFTISKKIVRYTNLAGYIIDLKNIDNENEISTNLFFISINHTNNILFIKDLINLAEKVNSYKSTLTDFKAYHSLKNKAIFIEDVYKYMGKIYTELEFKESHPMLFTKVIDTIDIKKKTMYKNDFINSFNELYDDLIENRMLDHKDISENETYADQFKVIEKDIYYGYSITSHKSQGSTYESVYVDENDFNKLQNRWNFKFNCFENKIKEKNQLKYVAYTRASKKLKIFI